MEHDVVATQIADRLIFDMVYQAIIDTLKGIDADDKQSSEARDWLAENADVLEEIGLVDDASSVIRWTENPTMPAFVTVQGAADLLEVSQHSIRRAVVAGELTAFRLPRISHGDGYYILPVDAIDWYNSRN